MRHVLECTSLLEVKNRPARCRSYPSRGNRGSQESHGVVFLWRIVRSVVLAAIVILVCGITAWAWFDRSHVWGLDEAAMAQSSINSEPKILSSVWMPYIEDFIRPSTRERKAERKQRRRDQFKQVKQADRDDRASLIGFAWLDINIGWHQLVVDLLGNERIIDPRREGGVNVHGGLLLAQTYMENGQTEQAMKVAKVVAYENKDPSWQCTSIVVAFEVSAKARKADMLGEGSRENQG